ncbi:MAG TPA: DUF2585 family protein [Pirellulales bacterium]
MPEIPHDTDPPENDSASIPHVVTSGMRRFATLPVALAIVAILLAGGVWLRANSRPWWCACGQPFLWSGQVQSSHNSQHLFDPYSFTHMLHGVVFFWVLALCLPRLSVPWRFVGAVTIETLWELLENSNMVIERYRTATMALGYEGDSIGNSFGDVLSCSLGFFLALRLGAWGSLALFLATELTLVLWIRDSLILSTLMLIHPLESLKNWQQGS